MSVSTDPGHFFQTEYINPSSSPSPSSKQSGDKSHAFRGHTAPVTSLALDTAAATLFAGSWDKTIISWSTATRKPLRTFAGHTDFVKSLLYLRNSTNGLLLSGASDAAIIIWDAVSGDRLFALSGHTRGVGVLVADPVLSTRVKARVYSAGSEPGMRCWEVPVEAAEVRGARGVGGVLVVHETSVNAVRFEGEEAEMWTASADMTAKRVDVRGEEGKGEGEGEVVARVDTVLEHPDYVNDIVVDPRGRWAVTACRDEEVRVWDVATGELFHIYDGHSEDVMALAIVGSKQDTVVSVSIDGTIRRWSLRHDNLLKAIEEKKEREQGKEKEKAPEKNESLLTIEEERELAELMEEEDDE
ncbi:WD40 repeat-like protein [Morchella conica CCBAS932]|uniref:WD40 repeat-like protein n=1 Tax=Morchella conica CCBAS932 TaxID=1392247 RepID=A0A3N4L1H7_9PEZI|nr:WD40 repeat-like protein [Morchella conica CCBAS932]